MRFAACSMPARGRRLRGQLGLTIVELLVAMTLIVLIAAPVATTLLKSLGVRSSQIKAANYQASYSALVSTFLDDVRSGTALVSSTTDPTSFTIQTGVAPNILYITYRFYNGMLQRGTSTTVSPGPTTWKDMFDGTAFRITGKIGYLMAGGAPTADNLQVSSLKISNIELTDLATKEVIKQPDIMAKMGSIGALSQVLILHGTAGVLGNHTVTFSVKNIAAQPVTISGYSASWSERSQGSVLQQIKCKGASGQGDSWKGRYNNYWPDSDPDDLDDNWTFLPFVGSSPFYDFRMRFNDKMQLDDHERITKKFSVCFYDIRDTQRTHPYVVNFTLPDGPLAKDDDHDDEDADEKQMGPKTTTAKYKGGHDRWGKGGDGEHHDDEERSYDSDGYDNDGYNREGRDRHGRDREGYDRDGYDKDGYDREGCDRDGYDRDGHKKDGHEKDHH